MELSISNLYGINILSKYPKKNDLINYLNQLHESLSKLNQEPSDRPKALKNLSLQLVTKQLLSNNDKEVRLLTTCCIVDILRIFAPDAPYNNEDTIVAFDAINQQLTGLSTYDAIKGVIQSKAFYILSSISTFQSCVVPVILSQNGVYGASETVIAMFEAILSSIRIEHPEDVFNHASSIFQACIEESEGTSEDLLDVLLLPLLSHNKTDNPAAYQLAFTLLRRVSTIIQIPISTFLNRILVGSSNETVGRSGSELTGHIYSLLYELHRVSPELLSRVIPNLCLQLQVEEEDIRFKAVKLLGSLFASSHAEYAKEFSRNFRDYLSRFNDLSPEIRLEMVENSTAVLKNKTSLYSLYEEPMVKRLRDADERVRLSSLTKLIDISYHKPLELSVNTYIEMGERVKDKRIEIKRTALVGLAKLYSRHVTVALPPLSHFASNKHTAPMNQNYSIRELVDTLILERLEFIPSLILKCWSYPEINNKYLVIQLLQEQLLPKENIYSSSSHSSSNDTTSSSIAITATNEINKSDSQCDDNDMNTQQDSEENSMKNSSEICERRATALLLLFECLSNSDRNFLASILCFKAKARVELQSFLMIRSTNSNISTSNNYRNTSERQSLFDRRISNVKKINSIVSSDENMKSLRKCIIKFMQLLPANDKKASYLEKLYSNKDRIIFRLLDHCVGSNDSITESISHREDLKKRLDSKSSVSEYMSTVYDVAGSLTVNSLMIQSLLNYIQKLSVHANALLPSELLVLLSKHCSHSFQGNGIQSIAKWLNNCISYENNKNKQKDMKAILFSDCYSIINYTYHAFEYEENQPHLCSTIITHIKKIASPEICIKLAELCSQIAYYSPDLESYLLLSSNNDDNYTSSLTMIQELLDSLTSSKVLNIRNKRLDCDLSILASLCSIPKAVYTTLNFTKPSFLSMMDSILSKSTCIINFITEQAINENNNNAIDTYTLSISLKLLTNILCTKEELHQFKCSLNYKEESISSNNPTQDSSSISLNHSIEFKKIIMILFQCIESKGRNLLNFNIENMQEKDFLFETAATCALTLMKLQSFTKEISIDQWHNLGWTFLHERVGIRQRLLHILNQIMQLSYIHPKFLAYSCLFAMDSSSSDTGLTSIAEQGLYIVIKRLRITHEELCSLAIEKQVDEDTITHQSIQKNAEHCMPEAVLPYLLHLLSYHPDFPTSISIDTEDDKKRMKNVVRCVHMLLKILRSSLTSDSDNMSYLFKQLNTINQQYVDKHDSDNIGLHFVTRMAVKLLNEQIKTSDNLQVYPAEIHLPVELYQRKSTMNKDIQLHRDGNVVINIKEGLEDAEQAIDKVLQFANKGNKGKFNATKNTNQTVVARSIIHKHNDITGSGIKSKKKIILTSPDFISNNNKRVSYSSDKDHIILKHNNDDDDKVLKKSKLPIEMPTRSMPKRGAKENIKSYMIPIENDREMLKWEQDASKSAAINNIKRPRLSTDLYSRDITEFSQQSNSMNKLQRLSMFSNNNINNNNIEGRTDTEFIESQESGFSLMKDASKLNVLNNTSTITSKTTTTTAIIMNKNKSIRNVKTDEINHTNDIKEVNSKGNTISKNNTKTVELPIPTTSKRNTRLIRG